MKIRIRLYRVLTVILMMGLLVLSQTSSSTGQTVTKDELEDFGRQLERPAYAELIQSNNQRVLRNATTDNDPGRRFIGVISLGEESYQSHILPRFKDSSPMVRGGAYVNAIEVLSHSPVFRTQKNFDDLHREIQSEPDALIRKIASDHLRNMSQQSNWGTKREALKGTRLGNLRAVVVSANPCAICGRIRSFTGAKVDINSLQVMSSDRIIPVDIEHLDIVKDSGRISELKLPANNPIGLYIYSGNELIVANPYQIDTSEEGLGTAIVQTLRAYSEKKAARETESQLFEFEMKLKPPTPARVILISTGKQAQDVPAFVRYSIKQISNELKERYRLTPSNFITLYGSGKLNTDDVVERMGPFPYWHKVEEFKPDASFTPEVLSIVYKTFAASPAGRNLIVLSGHGSPGGIDTWQGDTFFRPEDLQKLQSSSPSKNILVSGNCYGGQFAQAATCGFFAARPDKKASGCWEIKPDKLTDYTSLFFQAIRPEYQSQADLNNDGDITFEEAHWFAVMNVEPIDYPYTSIDALAEKYVKDRDVGLSGTPELSGMMSPGELRAFEFWSRKILTGQKVSYYNGQLNQLIRRLKFKKAALADRSDLGNQFRKLENCENTKISKFLGAK